jgi:hypothetical protein
MSLRRHACPLGKTHGEVALVGEQLQQAHDVTPKRGTGSERRRGGGKLHRRILIDAIGDQVLTFLETVGPATTISVRPARQLIESCIAASSEPLRDNVVAATIGE